MKTIIGVKGFDKNLECRNYKYAIGGEYVADNKPKLCRNGFHYSKTLSDCFKYYENKNGNRFCIVEILGDIDEGLDKCCTNKIKILRELTQDELTQKPDINYKYLNELNSNGFVIGGSLALMIHGYDLKREITDIDLVFHNKKDTEILEQFKGYGQINRMSGMDSLYCFKSITGLKYDILRQNKDVHSVVRRYAGFDLTIQDEAEIWLVKLQYALNGSIKHINDIKNCRIHF